MLKKSATVVILDNGEPSFVVVNYDTYKELVGGVAQEVKITNGSEPSARLRQGSGEVKEVELLERINKDILALKAQIEEEEKTLGTVE